MCEPPDGVHVNQAQDVTYAYAGFYIWDVQRLQSIGK